MLETLIRLQKEDNWQKFSHLRHLTDEKTRGNQRKRIWFSQSGPPNYLITVFTLLILKIVLTSGTCYYQWNAFWVLLFLIFFLVVDCLWRAYQFFLIALLQKSFFQSLLSDGQNLFWLNRFSLFKVLGYIGCC